MSRIPPSTDTPGGTGRHSSTVHELARYQRSDWWVVVFTLLLGAAETLSSGVGWPVLRAVAAVVIAGVLLQRRRAPLAVLVGTALITLGVGIVFRAADHFLLVTGLMFAVAIYALVRWGSGRDRLIGAGVVGGHAIAGLFVIPNADLAGTLLFYVSPVVLAWALRPPVESPRVGGALRSVGTSMPIRATAAWLVVVVLLIATGGVFLTDQIASYVTRTRSPEMPGEWSVDAPTLRLAAESSRGTHGPDGAIVHVVDYPHQLLAALEHPSFSVEADVTVIDGSAFLQHDPKDPVGLPLIEFLEYAAIAEFPIVKLDLKRDRVGPIIGEVRQAIERFGLDPRRLHFNADVFRGPGVENNWLGARTDLSTSDSLYNLVIMELETSDLVRIAEQFPESTIVISATPPSGGGASAPGYSEDHLARFVRAADAVRAVNSGQSLVFAVRGDLAARSGPHLLDGLAAIEDSYVAAWWSADVPPTAEAIETLRSGGVTFFDLGQEAAD